MEVEGTSIELIRKTVTEIKEEKVEVQYEIEITEKMKEVLEDTYNPNYSRLLPYRVRYLGTASKNGIPNVNIVSLIKVVDKDKILLADATFIKSRKNLEENPLGALIVEEYRKWDFSEKRKGKIKSPRKITDIVGWQFKGRVKLEKEGKYFDMASKLCMERFGPIFMLYAAVILHVEEIYSTVTGRLLQTNKHP